MLNLEEHKYNLPPKEDLRTPFEVPVDYFSQFPGRVIIKVMSTESLTVPTGYFEDFAGRLMGKIHAKASSDEIADLAPNLQRIGKQMPYHVPGGYFDEFTVNRPILQKTQAPVFNVNKVTKWAVAACLIALLGFTFWTFVGSPVDNQSSAESAAAAALANLPDDVFTDVADAGSVPTINSLQVAMGWKAADKALETFSADELQRYLQNSGLEELYNN